MSFYLNNKGSKKTKYVGIRLEEELFLELKEISRILGIDISTYIRLKLNDTSKDVQCVQLKLDEIYNRISKK